MVWGIAKLYRPIKKRVRLRLDSDVLAWFKKQGRGYQTRINRVLRRVMMKERKEPDDESDRTGMRQSEKLHQANGD